MIHIDNVQRATLLYLNWLNLVRVVFFFIFKLMVILFFQLDILILLPLSPQKMSSFDECTEH